MIKDSVKRNVSIAEWDKAYEAFAGAIFAVNAKSERVVLHNSITNYYRLFWDIRNRTAEDRAYFLNKLHKEDKPDEKQEYRYPFRLIFWEKFCFLEACKEIFRNFAFL